jgi:hypothetical protein
VVRVETPEENIEERNDETHTEDNSDVPAEDCEINAHINGRRKMVNMMSKSSPSIDSD